MRLATSVCASFVLILPLAFGGDADGTAQKESRPYRYEFKRIPAPKVPDVSAIIAEDSAGRIYFAFPGKDGGLLRWDGKAIKDVVRGDVGGVATGPGGTCYYTLGQDLWMIGWPDADNRMVLPAFQGRAAGARRVFVGRLGDLWLEGCPEIQMPDGTMRAAPEWYKTIPIPVATDQHNVVLGIAWSDGRGAAGSVVALLPGQGEKWCSCDPWQGYVGSRGPPPSLVNSPICDELGFGWVVSQGRLHRYDLRARDDLWMQLSGESLRPVEMELTALGLSPDGKALTGFADGKLVEVEMGADRKPLGRLLTRQDLLDAPRGIHADSAGGLWVVAGGGVYHAEAAPDAWQRNWKPLARMPWGNHDIFGAVLDGKPATNTAGKLYTAAGMASHGYPAVYTHFAELFVYDPRADSWAIAGRMDRPRCYSGTAVLDGKVWVIGGYFGPDDKRVSTDEVQVFDPKTGKFALGPKLDRPRAEPVCDTVGGRLYVIGGADGKEELASVVSIGAGETAWRAEPEAPGPIRQASGCALDGKMYVCAGPQGVLCFDPAAGKWEKIEGLAKAPRAALTAAHAGEAWIMGGYDTPEPRAAHVYSPKTGKWRRGPDLPTSLGWGAAVEIGGRLIIAGGAYYSEPHKYYIFTDRTLMLRDR